MNRKLYFTFIVGLLALAVISCSTTQTFYWDKKGATEEQTRRDSADCNFKVQQMGQVLLPSDFRALMIQCMKGKGYSEASEGAIPNNKSAKSVYPQGSKQKNYKDTVTGIIKTADFQGNNFLYLTLINSKDNKEVRIECSGGKTKVYSSKKAVFFTDLKEGKKIKVDGDWITQDGELLLWANRVDILMTGNLNSNIVLFDKNVPEKQRSSILDIANAIRSGKYEAVARYTKKGKDPNEIIRFWSSADHLSKLKFKARKWDKGIVLSEAEYGMSSSDLIIEGNRLVISDCIFNDGN